MYAVPFGKGIIRMEGTDVTVVAVSQMLYESIKAARILAEEGISVEVIDPRTLVPLDMELIEESVRRTGRLVVTEPACRTGGVAAEIVCRLAESAPDILKKAIRRVGFPDTPTPCSPVLENLYYPGCDDMVTTIKEMM